MEAGEAKRQTKFKVKPKIGAGEGAGVGALLISLGLKSETWVGSD